jgi:hypothetical protein
MPIGEDRWGLICTTAMDPSFRKAGSLKTLRNSPTWILSISNLHRRSAWCGKPVMGIHMILVPGLYSTHGARVEHETWSLHCCLRIGVSDFGCCFWFTHLSSTSFLTLRGCIKVHLDSILFLQKECKVKVKSSLCLTKYALRHKTHGGVDV